VAWRRGRRPLTWGAPDQGLRAGRSGVPAKNVSYDTRFLLRIEPNGQALAPHAARVRAHRRHDRGEQAEGGDRQISVRFGKHLAALFGAGPVRAADAGSLNSAYRLLTVSV
jgi:hypothetical protein